jgi:hypothetical protein
MKPACSAAKIKGRTAFCHGEAPDWAFWCASAKAGSGESQSIDLKVDRSTSTKIRLIDFKGRSSDIPDFPNSMYFCLKFVISLLMSYKTQKHKK